MNITIYYLKFIYYYILKLITIKVNYLSIVVNINFLFHIKYALRISNNQVNIYY